MEMQPVTAQPPDQLRFIFFNDHGLRAGWRLAIFFGLLFPIGFVVLALRSLAPQFPRMSPYRTILGESALFLAVALTSWIMSRIEKREMGSYGLPLRRNALSDFVVGYIVWGFLALTLLLAAMRALNVFDFGSLALHGNDILKFGMLWGVAFLLVGFFEEYLTRGYLLQTLADGIGFWPAAVDGCIRPLCQHYPATHRQPLAGRRDARRVGLGPELFLRRSRQRNSDHRTSAEFRLPRPRVAQRRQRRPGGQRSGAGSADRDVGSVCGLVPGPKNPGRRTHDRSGIGIRIRHSGFRQLQKIVFRHAFHFGAFIPNALEHHLRYI